MSQRKPKGYSYGHVMKLKQEFLNKVEQCSSIEELETLKAHSAYIKKLMPSRAMHVTLFNDIMDLTAKIDEVLVEKENSLLAVVDNSDSESETSEVQNDDAIENSEDFSENSVPEKAAREAQVVQLRAQLKLLMAKSDEHAAKTGRQYVKAAQAAKRIYDDMTGLLDQYVEEGDVALFKVQVQSLLTMKNSDVKELNKHREFKGFIANLLACLTVIGMFVSNYKGNGLFSPVRTGSNAMLNGLRMGVEEFNPDNATAAPSA